MELRFIFLWVAPGPPAIGYRAASGEVALFRIGPG